MYFTGPVARRRRTSNRTRSVLNVNIETGEESMVPMSAGEDVSSDCLTTSLRAGTADTWLAEDAVVLTVVSSKGDEELRRPRCLGRVVHMLWLILLLLWHLDS